jgi:hypothetical protein
MFTFTGLLGSFDIVETSRERTNPVPARATWKQCAL